jgi:hypothetical protein
VVEVNLCCAACVATIEDISFCSVKQPFVNVEEKIDRFVGRRTRMASGLSTATSNKSDSIAWRKAFGGVRVPRGVYRFKTHEEADQWLWRMITRPTS